MEELVAAEPRYPTVHVEVGPDDVDEASALLFELGATGVEERDATTLEKPSSTSVLLVAHFDDEDEARIAIEAVGFPATLQHVVGDAWRHRWREFFKASRVGERVVIRPPWEEVVAAPNDVIITIDPGQAFGTGTHETTRLVLAELEKRVTGGERVLDIGCGSGILSIGALLLGAKSAVGIDVERESVDASHENAERNGVDGKLTASLMPLARLPGTFPLVVANVESRVLVPFAKDIAAKVAPGGLLILSGLLSPEEAEVLAAYPGFERLDVTREKDWIAITLRASAKTSEDEAPARSTGNAVPKRKVATVAKKKKKVAKKTAAKKTAAKKKTATRKAPTEKAAAKKKKTTTSAKKKTAVKKKTATKKRR